jgi:cobalt-zinc-cadmium efflux system protein
MTTDHQPHHHDQGRAGGAHHHDHASHAGHHHGVPDNMGRAFVIGIVLNSLFVLAEWGFGILSHSLALLADATHNLGDVLGLALAGGAALLSRRAPSERFTYGLRGTSIIAALANATLLILVTGGLAWEAIQRFQHPQPVAGATVIAVALAGVLVNGFTAWLFLSGSKSDLNVRGAYLHMAADAAGSLGVAVAGVMVYLTGWLWLDPAVTLALAAVIVVSSWGLLRDAFQLALQAVPQSVELAEVRDFLGRLPGVREVHDLHIWGMSTTENAMTAHLIIPGGHPGDAFLQGAAREVEQRFAIHHVTLQIEVADAEACALAPAHVV